MIVTPENMSFDNKKFSLLIYGEPGIGKTTMALSAPNPVLLDFDRGISRVAYDYWKPAEFFFFSDVQGALKEGKSPEMIAEKLSKYGVTLDDVHRLSRYKSAYDEVLYDLNTPAVQNCETIVIDTGGSFVTLLKDWAVSEGGRNVTKSGGISQSGYGTVKNEFAAFVDRVKTVLNKNIIFVFHTTEGLDQDGNPIQRLQCEGATRTTVWNACDFGCFVRYINGNRTACFAPSAEYQSKGTYGIKRNIPIPELGASAANDFVAKQIFGVAKAIIRADAEKNAAKRAEAQAQYDRVMESAKAVIETVTDVDTANKALSEIMSYDHAKTSKEESWNMLKNKAGDLGLKYTKQSGFIPKEG